MRMNEPIAYLHNAVNNGGAGLVAADTFTQIGFVRRPNNNVQDWARIEGPRVESSDKKSVLKIVDEDGKDTWLWDCPFVVPLTARDFPDAAPDDSAAARIFKGLTRIATNVPSYLRVSGFTGEFRFALARFPDNSFRVTQDGFGNTRKQRLPDDALFAIAGEGPDFQNNGTPYRFMAMADHSVFINQMLIEPGTQNLELAYRTIDYLQGPSKRKRCLFIENGRIIERFDDLAQAFQKSRPIPIPDPGALQEKLTNLGNAFVDELQTKNVPNNMLLRAFRHPVIVRFFIILGAIFATWYLLRRIFAMRKSTDLPPSPVVAAAATGPPGVFERRQKELIRRDNLYEPVRDMVREFFASTGIHGIQHGPKLPKLVISDAVRRPESLRLAIKDFWRLAYGPPQEVTIARWRELEPYLERLQQAHADGKWHFVLADAPVAVGV
jgi:hypothetical protein